MRSAGPGPELLEPSWDLYDAAGAQDAGFVFRDSPKYQRPLPGDPGRHPSMGILNLQRGRTCVFRAERYNVGRIQFGPNTTLNPSANNLAEVLANLQGNPPRFAELCGLVKTVLPEVQLISTQGVEPQEVEIRVWNHDPSTKRADLAVPLSECGTGLGQVLAILYVVLTSDRPQTIMIDEPQTFLHPGAARTLIEILKDFPQHQFIIATHSPTIVAAANPATVTLVTRTGGESVITSVDSSSAAEVRVFLSEVGASLGDLFGADNVLWVEGATEEECFALIVEKRLRRKMRATIIKGVRDTGSFEGKHADLVIDVYQRLSGSASLLPPAIGFIFDSENKTSQAKHEITNRSDGRARFIRRRMYENYLLDATAVAEVMNQREGFREVPVTAVEVSTFFDGVQKDKKYFPQGSDVSEDWKVSVDGARVLGDVFSTLSQARCSYRKPTDAVLLTEWMIKNSAEELEEITTLLEEVLSQR